MTPQEKSQSLSARRAVEAEIEIAAPVDAVWKALTDAEELTRWFCLDAEVTPGEGGSIWLSWEDLAAWHHEIEIWEPGAHLRTVYVQPSPTEPPLIPKKRIAETPSGTAVQIGVDFFLEARGGGTVLRVVHVGFGADASWDGEYHGVRRGWRYELRSLRHYLEKHPGAARKVAWAKKAIKMSSEEAWNRLMSPDGMLEGGGLSGLSVGGSYDIRSSFGQAFEGIVQTLDPPFEFSGTVVNLGESLLRVAVEMDITQPAIVLWLATYGMSKVQFDELQAAFEALLERLFPEQS